MQRWHDVLPSSGRLILLFWLLKTFTWRDCASCIDETTHLDVTDHYPEDTLGDANGDGDSYDGGWYLGKDEDDLQELACVLFFFFGSLVATQNCINKQFEGNLDDDEGAVADAYASVTRSFRQGSYIVGTRQQCQTVLSRWSASGALDGLAQPSEDRKLEISGGDRKRNIKMSGRHRIR